MIRRLSNESGAAIVMAVALMSAMLAVGLAAYSFVDSQQTQSMRERHRESSFNFAEAALNAQAFVLSRRWAGTQVSFIDTGGAATCSNASAPIDYCPEVSQLTAGFTSADYAAGVTWTTTVWDNVSGQFYDPDEIEDGTTADGDGRNFHWDANGDKKVWIKAEATVRNRTRRVVALVQINTFTEELPKRTIVAGTFRLTPNGNHEYVKTVPDEASGTHEVTVRCSNVTDTACMDYSADKKTPQIDPRGAVIGGAYVEAGTPVDVLGADTQARLRERAEADGTLYDGCPTSAQLAGEVVWVENCAAINAKQNDDWNSEANPGLLIWSSGTLKMDGNGTYYGVIYHLNTANSNAPDLVQLRGGLTVDGGVFVDGWGGIDVGSNKVNIVYDGDAFTSVQSYGTADIVQNSWRELSG